MRRFRRLHDLRQHAAHVLGVDEKDECAVRADAGFAEDARALGFELGLGGVDVGDFEADVMLAAERVLLEELQRSARFRRAARSARSALGVSTKQTRTPCAGRSKAGAVRLGVEHGAVEFEALLDRRRGDADVVEAAEFHCSIVTSVVTELAMKQASCARWWRSAMAVASGALAPQVTCGRSVTRVIAILPSARFSKTPSALST